MEYSVEFLDPSKEDIAKIVIYLSQFYPSTPLKFLKAIEKGKTTLQYMPYIFPIYIDKPEYRKMVVADYLVFYKIDETKRVVEIHRVLHGSRDINKHLV